MSETTRTPIVIRRARPGDEALVLEFVRKLAAYEKLEAEVEATEALLHEALFGEVPRVYCDFAEVDGTAVGFALWFYNFSTFKGRHGIYLEDLFVEPAFQGHGIGKTMLRHLAKRCVDEGLGRFEWWVLDWNKPSIAFYKSLGSVPMDEWTVFRVTGEALQALADGLHPDPTIEDVEGWA